MTIKYECKQCDRVIFEGPEMDVSLASLLGATALITHATGTGHRLFDYKSERSVLEIKVSHSGEVSLLGKVGTPPEENRLQPI